MWSPSRDPSLGPPAGEGTAAVLPLLERCMAVLSDYVDCIESLEGVPDTIKVVEGNDEGRLAMF